MMIEKGLYKPQAILTGDTTIAGILDPMRQSMSILQFVLDQALQITGSELGDLALYEEQSDELKVQCKKGPLFEHMPQALSAREGISGRTVRERRTQHVPDVLLDSDHLELIKTWKEGTGYGRFLRSFRSIVKLPILDHDRLVGVLGVHNPSIDAFSGDQIWQLERLVRCAGPVIAIAKTLQETARLLDRAYRTLQNVLQVAASEDLGVLLKTTLEEALKLMECEHGSIRLLDEDRKYLFLADSNGLNQEDGVPLARPIDSGVAGEAVRRRQPVLVNDALSHLAHTALRHAYDGTPYGSLVDTFESVLVVPLVVRDQVIGVISAYHTHPSGFTQDHSDAVNSLATVVAPWIYTSMLNQKARLLEEMVEYFDKLVTMPDEDKILQDVLDYACEMAGCVGGQVSILDPEGKFFTVSATSGRYLDLLPDRQPISVGVTGRAIQDRKTQFISNLTEDPNFFPLLKAPTGSHAGTAHELIVVPLIFHDVAYGVICLHGPQPMKFTVVRLSLLERLGGYTAGLIVRSREYHALFRLGYLAELGNLAGFVAHEINTPLHNIRLASDRLLATAVTDEGRELLSIIRAETERGAHITQKLFHSIPTLTPEQWDLSTVVMNALDLAQGALRHRSIVVRTHLAPGLPPFRGITPTILTQILFNLLWNAAGAMPGGGEVTIEAGLSRDQRYLQLLVRDTGPGIPEAHREMVFQPYFTTKAPGQGTGLGLALCRTALRQGGGDIEVASEVGKGSAFTVSLPVERVSSNG